MSKFCAFLFLIVMVGTYTVNAGNPDRAGESGAPELLFNPWARSAGLFAMNSSRVEGLEAMRINVAGLTFAKKTEVIFSRTHWLQGSTVYVNAFGVAQKFGKGSENAIGLSFMALDLGETRVTTVDNPQGSGETFKPQFFNIGFAYSRAFSNSIRAGLLVRLITSRITDVRAFGFAVDMGIQYVTGPLDNIRFGVALRNIGTPMSYAGDGLSFRGESPDGTFNMTLNQRSSNFELPSLLNIGASYDMYLDNVKNHKDQQSLHRLSIIVNFTANSFGKDFVGGGLEYSWREILMLRGGYRWEEGITDPTTRTSAHTGFAAGFTAQVPLKKDGGPSLAFDYAYKTSDAFSGTHTYSIRFNLGSSDVNPKKIIKEKKDRKEKKKDKATD